MPSAPSSRIIQPPAPRKSAPAHRVVSRAEERCELVTGVLEARQLAGAARNVASDVYRENFDAVASPHHRTRSEESTFAGNHRRRTVRKMSLRGIER